MYSLDLLCIHGIEMFTINWNACSDNSFVKLLYRLFFDIFCLVIWLTIKTFVKRCFVKINQHCKGEIRVMQQLETNQNCSNKLLDTNQNNNDKFLLACIGGGVSIEIAYYYMISEQILDISNIKVYILGLLIFGIVWFGLILCTARIQKFAFPNYGRISFVIFFSILLFCGYDYLLKEQGFYDYYGWNIFPKSVSFYSIILFVIILIPFYCHEESSRTGKLYPVYFVSALLYGITKYNPNMLHGDVYDSDAYISSIFNVYHNIPYTIDTTGIYGHYGIFFKIPMTILGGEITIICLGLAIVAFVTMLAFCYIIEKLINSNVTKILCIGAVLSEPLYALPHSYYASSPNRYLVPLLMLAWITYCMNKQITKFHILIGCMIGLIGMVWNFESGFVSAVSWGIFLVILMFQNSKLNKESILKSILIMSLVLLELIGAILVVSIYNILCGGPLCIKDFFYPLNHHLKDFVLPLQWGNYAYIYIIPICMCIFAWGVYHTTLFGRKHNLSAFLVADTVIIIGLCSYYMNRFASCNVWIFFWEFVIILGLIIEKGIPKLQFRSLTILLKKDTVVSIYQGIKSAIALMSFIVLSALSLSNVFSANMQLDLYKAGIYNVNELRQWGNEIASVVPENTYAIGLGTGTLYSILDWDTGYHINDWPNLPARPEAYEKCITDLQVRDSVFMDSEVFDVNFMVENLNFTVAHTFVFGSRTYYYLIKSGV